ncbi:hypothetical protein BSKO_08586 [Bryopsis sp. KO-2023]|nr:hypothetical protein BSKO_08586 [Bryopsis sp. KO-2023]
MRRTSRRVLPNGYRHVADLGEGGQASVVLAKVTRTEESGKVVEEEVAVKCYERGLLAQRNRRNRVRREVCNLRRLRHPHIVLFRTLKVTQTDLCVVMEYQKGGTLENLLRRSGKLSESTARSYFQQLWFAVDFAHQMGVSNRDIKPANVLFRSENEDYLVLCDFGLSKYEHSLQGPSAVGTRGYGAPELMLPSGRRWTAEDLQRADAYSCGVTLFQMLFGVEHWPRYAPPARATQDQNQPPNHMEVIRSLMGDDRQEIEFPGGPSSVSGSCAELLTGLLQPNPRLRTMVGQIPTQEWFSRGLPEGTTGFNAMLLDAHNNGEVQNNHLPGEPQLIRLINEAAGVAQ